MKSTLFIAFLVISFILSFPVLAQLETHKTIICGQLTGQQGSTRPDLIQLMQDAYGIIPNQICIIEPVFVDGGNVRLSAEINVFGTEYPPDPTQIGKVFIQLIDVNGTIDDASCLTTVFNPDGTKFITDAPLLFLERGVYDKDFVVPEVLGVYPVTVTCDFGIAFQEHFAFEIIETEGIILQGVLEDTFDDAPNSFLTIKEVGSGATKELDFRFNFSNVSIVNQNSINIIFDGQWTDGNEDMMIFIFNHSSSTFFKLPNDIVKSQVDVTVTNNIGNNLADFVQNGNVLIRFADENGDSTGSDLKIDLLKIELLSPAQTPLLHLKGAGEIHIVKFALTNQSVTEIVEKGVNETVEDIDVFATEYVAGVDTFGSVFAQVTRANKFIDSAQCNATAFFPNQSKFLDNVGMPFLGEKGIYITDFILGDDPVLGVYPVSVECAFSPNRKLIGASEIHVRDFPVNITVDVDVLVSEEINLSQADINKITSIFLLSDVEETLLKNDNVCIDNQTLVHMLVKIKCINVLGEQINQTCFTIETNVTETCENGCDFEHAVCNPSPFQTNIIILGIFVFVLFIILILWKKYG